jgi:chromosome segregation ATPase
MGNLVKASELQMPTVSGVVSIPLAELDRMRADHVAAVKLAQELESKQHLVKVSYRNAYSSHLSYPTKEVVDTEYKNMEEFRAQIRSEEFNKFKVQFEKQEREMTSLKSKLLESSKELEKNKSELANTNLSLKNIEKEYKEVGELLAKSTTEVKSLSDRTNADDKIIEGLKKSVERLVKDKMELEHKKGFWGFL